MAPTIRIDDDVYSWLQKHAKPFEDTPNSVLRRKLGLDLEKEEGVMSHTKISKPQSGKSGGRLGLSGRQLNKEWGVGARHALFHKDGTWFNNLERFPGALFDPEGYVIFSTEEEYLSSPFVKIGKETNVPKGISSMPGYVRKRKE